MSKSNILSNIKHLTAGSEFMRMEEIERYGYGVQPLSDNFKSNRIHCIIELLNKFVYDCFVQVNHIIMLRF